jgi:hypothetical protein
LAKKAVEIAIEEGEEVAMEYIKEKGEIWKKIEIL